MMGGSFFCKKSFPWAFFAAACLLWLLAVSNQSLWLDELFSAAQSGLQPSILAWWEQMISKNERLTPGYLFYIWGFARIFGVTEGALRAANLPLLIIGFGVFVGACKARPDLQKGFIVAAATCPFIWYYINEARPYIMQAGSTFLIAGSCVLLLNGASKHWFAALSAGILLLCSSNLLGAFWAGAAVATICMAFGRKGLIRLVAEHEKVLTAMFAFGAFLVFYYFACYRSGSQGNTEVGTTNANNLIFVVYELLGFGGLGPGRMTLRYTGLSAFKYYLPFLVVYALILSPVAAAGLKEIFAAVPRRVLFTALVAFGGVFAFLFLVGVSTHFRLLGRHCTPLIFFVVVVLGGGIGRLWRQAAFYRWLAVAFILASLASAISFRFAARHEKEDYRAAATAAKAALAEGRAVWWNALHAAGAYYRIPLADRPEDGKVLCLFNASSGMVKRRLLPDIIIAAQPDIYDKHGAVCGVLAGYHQLNKFTTITVWERAASSK